MMKSDSQLAKALTQLRKSKGISQNELARLCSLNRTYISLVERGERNPTVKVLVSISRALDTKASWVLRRIGE